MLNRLNSCLPECSNFDHASGCLWWPEKKVERYAVPNCLPSVVAGQSCRGRPAMACHPVGDTRAISMSPPPWNPPSAIIQTTIRSSPHRC